MHVRMSALFMGLCLLVPIFTHAQIRIGEVMYDLAEGSDSGREWIEVFNAGAATDLTAWKLFEANTNHSINEFQGGATIPSGAYAILADNPAKFIIDWPNYKGLIFDSVFSLSNSGETLSIRTKDLVDVDSMSYTPEMGAAGDGKTLSRASNTGTFAPQIPTPGEGTLTVEETSALPQTTSSSSTASSNNTFNSGSSMPVEPELFAYAGSSRAVLVGADVSFSGKAYSKDGEVLEGNGVRYVWNFGDGETSEKQSTTHHFAHEGVYVVTLDVSSGKNTASHRVKIDARTPQIRVEQFDDGGVAIHNDALQDIDISFWHLRVGIKLFTVPKNTVVLGKGTTYLRKEALSFPLGDVVLLFPNGNVVPKWHAASSGSPTRSAPFSVHTPRAISEDRFSAPAVAISTTTDREGREVHATGSVSQAASIGASMGFIPGWEWIIGLCGLLALGIAGVWFGASGASEKNSIAGWEIIDASEEVR